MKGKRTLDLKSFESVYRKYVCSGNFHEEDDYYPRYAARYRDLMRVYASIAPDKPQKILEIGGGQLALLASKLWRDAAHVADLGGKHLDFLRSEGISTHLWNLCADDSPIRETFDVIFFSEVIEHLPIPGNIVLKKIKGLLSPGGILICTTPNLYRIRNVVYMALGVRIFDYFRSPDGGDVGHVIEYSLDHLDWQLEVAGFPERNLTLHEFARSPGRLVSRIAYWLGRPLLLVPRFRNSIIAIAKATSPPSAMDGVKA